MSIPPLAGLCTYQEAATVGYGVDETVNLLVRYAWIEKRMMEMGLYWMNPTPEWEVKEALSLHLYLDSEHAGWMRQRVSEMRNPPPRMDVSPNDQLNTFLNEILCTQDTLEKLVGLYGVLKPALLEAYRDHYQKANPLVDHPTRRILQNLIAEEEQAAAWGKAAIDALTTTSESRSRAQEWSDHLTAYLQAAGGINGEAVFTVQLPPSHAQGAFQPDFFPRRDERFVNQGNFVFPPHEVARTDGVPADEKTLALMCKRALEMDVPEAMARMIAEARNQSWEYYVDMCRQLWDEARHAMMGSVYFEQIGVDWRSQIPLHPGFAIRLNQHMSPVEAHAVLYTIEQSLMPADTGKKYEWVTAGEAENTLARFYQDFDWADEVLHVYIGRRCGLKSAAMNREEFMQIGTQKAVESEKALEQYADPAKQVNWWPAFVRSVLGKESAVGNMKFDTSDPVYRKAGV